MLLASIVSAVVKTDGGNTLIREVKISTRGGTLSGVLYIPKDALENDGFGNYTSPRPAVILSHGYLNSNQMQDPNAIELSRRGFVVLQWICTVTATPTSLTPPMTRPAAARFSARWTHTTMYALSLMLTLRA